MKKVTLIWLLLCCIIFVGCVKQQSWEDWWFYAENLTIKWVGPEISMEPTVEDWTLVLARTFEDMSVHVFLSKWLWENYFKNESDYLPWNKVTLKWLVETLDWAAGNHYYNVKSVEKLEIVDYPTGGEIKDLLDSYNYCETDDDCRYIAWECPFGCYVPLYKNFTDIAWKVMDNYFKVNGKSCVYSCLYADKVVCENYKCEMVESEENWANEYSNNTLIISMIEWTDKSMIDKYLLKKYNLEILYEYENFNTIAVKFDNKMTEEDLDKTISEIEKIWFVIWVEKDYISHIN